MPLILRSSTTVPLTNDQMDGNWLTLQQQITSLQTTVGTLTGYTLPTASASVLGGIKVGTGLAIDGAGVLSATGSGGSYTLPIASASVLGGIKVGTGLAIDGAGVLSATGSGGTTYTGGTGITISGTTISTSASVPLLNTANTWTGVQTFAPGSGFGAANPWAGSGSAVINWARTNATSEIGIASYAAYNNSESYASGINSADAATTAHMTFWVNTSGNINSPTWQPAGNITSPTASSVAYNTSSDRRLKTNIILIDSSAASNIVSQLKPSTFTWISDPQYGTDAGFIADEVQLIVPKSVTGAKDEVDANGNPVYQKLNQTALIPYLTAALQDALNRIKVLEAKTANLP